MVTYRAAVQGMLTGVLLAVARISGETAPLLFTALNNQFWSADLNAPMANLPVVIFQFAMSPYADWQSAGLGRGLADHRRHPGPQHHRPDVRRMEQLQAMNAVDDAIRRLRADIAMTAAGAADPASSGSRPTKVEIRDVSFFYGEFQALKNISLPLRDRRVTAFIGPSGCGKSTLLRILNRIYELYPASARPATCWSTATNILAPGLDLNRLRAKIGMVFQKPTPFPMSIYDNIAFGIRLYERLPKAELDDRVESALRRAALWDEVKDKLRKAASASRAASSSGCASPAPSRSKPEILLLDEPASALDPISTQRIEELIAELKSRLLHRDRHAQHAAGGAQLRLHGVSVSRRIDRVRRDRADLHPPEGEAHRGLHHRPVRLTARDAMPAEHIIKSYDEELDRLNKMIVEMGGLAESQLAAAIEAVVKRDSELAARVVEDDAKVDQLERDLDNLAIRLLALRQPMARDLREIVAALKIASDLERICDYAANVAKRSIALAQIAADPAGARAAADGASGAALGQGRDRRLCRARRRQGDRRVARATKSSTRCIRACSANS